MFALVLALGLHIDLLNIQFAEAKGRNLGYITEAPRRASPRKPKRKNDRRRKQKLGVFKITAYCPCRKCSGPYGRHTATGRTARASHTIAVDKRVIPYFSRVYIPGIGEFVAEDCGWFVKGNHIDIFFNTHKEVERFGRTWKKIYLKG